MSWWDWRAGSDGNAASGKASEEDQRKETPQTSVHAQKTEKEGESQERARRAKLEAGVMGRPGREQRKGCAELSWWGRDMRMPGAEGNSTVELCWTSSWKKESFFVFKTSVQCGCT